MITRKKIQLLMLLTALYTLGKSQNLVPNGSFEEYSQCPYGENGIGYGYVTDWFTARSSPDYFNSCSTESPLSGVPSNLAGYQMPLDGQAYVGIITNLIGSQIPPNVREIIGTTLIAPLTIGVKYYVSAYVSRGFNTQIACATNNIGFLFSTIQYISIDGGVAVPIDNFSHINSTTVMADTTNWVWIGGSFIADSAYQYVMIGNFYNDEHTDTAECYPSPDNHFQSYYYIDDIRVSTDSAFCSNHIPTGIAQLNNRPIIFPNPVKNNLNIDNSQHNKWFVLFDSKGRKVMEGKLIDGLNTIDVGSYERGLYFLQIDNSGTKILFTN